MQRIRQLLLIIATIASISTLAVAPVAAEHGSGSGSGDSTTSNTSGSGSSGTSTSSDVESATETEQEATDPTPSTEVKAEIESIREHARQTVDTERKSGHTRSLEARQRSCTARQAEINTRVSNYAAAAQRHLGVFEGLLTKVQDFYTTKKLNVANYDTLLATAQSKQADAQKAVDALKALNVSIDCTSSDPAQSVASVKAAVTNARTALQAYRTAIKDLVVALKGASTAQDATTTTDTTETTTGGNQ